jgi:hypothetical protein
VSAKASVAAIDGATSSAIPAGDVTWRAIDRALRNAQATVSAGEPARTLRFDLAESGVTPLIAGRIPAAGSREFIRTSAPRSGSRGGQRLAWLVAALGVVMVGLGVGMMGWSAMEGRADLWNPAVGATLAGQGLVIVALLQLLTHVWSACRHAVLKLSQMHEELRRLRRATEEQSGRHAATAGQFYAELARGAGNDVLLGNLRGQVEQLAVRLHAE